MTIQTNTAAVPVSNPSAVAERSALTAALVMCGDVIKKRNTIPILGNVRILAGDDGAAFVTATDLDIEMSVRIPAAVDDGFGTTIPALLFRDLLKKARASDHVAITDDGEGYTVADFETVNYRLQSLPVADYPEMPGPGHNSAHRFTMTGADFLHGLEKTRGTISTEETRYYLNGVFLHVETGANGPESLRMVATDGHRMSVQEFPVPDGAAGMPEVIIPRKTVALLAKLLKGKTGPDSVAVEVDHAKLRLSFVRDGLPVTVTSKAIDGTFPDYRRVIPTTFNTVATVDSESLLETAASVSLISSERGRAVRMVFGDGKCSMTVNNPDTGSAHAEFACNVTGDAIEIGVNHSYLAQMMAIAGSETVTIHMSDSGAPILFKTSADDGWTGVQMPMRVK